MTKSATSDNEQFDLAQALEMVKSSKNANQEVMGQYHQDLVKWARNVDKRYAWVVLAALWLIMASVLGPYRIYGLVFAKVTNDGIYTREQASWPVSMIFTVENIVGPLVSVVAYHISFRSSLLVGGILLALGNTLTFWSDSIWVDTILIGFVQGIGFAFIFMPYMSIINEYFLKYRNIAFGFSLCGGTISVFALNPLFQWILEAYPWRTAYLGLGAVCCVTVLMVPFLKSNPKPTPPACLQAARAHLGSANKGGALSRMSFRALSFQNSHRRQSTILISRQGNLNRHASVISVNPFASSAGLERRISRSIVENFRQPQATNVPPQFKLHNEPTRFLQSNGASFDDSIETRSLAELAQEKESEFELKTILNILKTPGFHLIWYLELVYFWVFSIFCLVLVDFGVDRGCTRDQAETLISFQSVGEMLGRMGLTILVDMKFLSNKNVVVLNLCIIASLLVGVTQVQNYPVMAFLTVCINAFASLLYILLNGLLVDFLGEQQVTIGYGMASFVVGILITARPQAVGFFRDSLGSYNLLMIAMACACVLGALLCLLERAVNQARCNKATKKPADESNA